MIALIVLLVVGVALAYALGGRAWLKQQPFAQGFFDWIEPLERRLYGKSETMLMARLLSVGSFVVTLHDAIAVFAQTLDWTPVTTRIWMVVPVPEDLRPMVMSGTLALIGLAIAWLRKRTAKPYEIVAAPTTPETEAAELEVELANEAAREAAAAAAGVPPPPPPPPAPPEGT